MIWVIVTFVMARGARASTIINIKLEDLDFCLKEIKYTHLKNKRIAIIPMSSHLDAVLKQYLHLWDIGNTYLFPKNYS